ncbi:MAG: hypothetical protein SFT93_01160 [Rickettsiaceae bacterium]|nr:hypothetical protein [Rickettsiaceae bacterium]
MNNLVLYNLRQFFVIKSMFVVSSISVIISFIAIGLAEFGPNSAEFVYIITIIFPLIATNSFADQIIGDDYESGNLDFQIIAFEIYEVVISKFLALFAFMVCVLFVSCVSSSIIFSLDVNELLLVFLGSTPVAFSSSGAILAFSAINVYFEKKAKLISSVILSFIIPSIIMFGLFVNLKNWVYLIFALGINLIIVPIFVYSSIFLIKDIYNN